MGYSLGFFLSHVQGCCWPTLLIIISSFMIIIKALKYHLIEKPKKPKLPPGPKPWPIVGQLPEMLANKPAPRWIHKLMKKMNTDIACIRLGNVLIIPVTCPSIAREFLRKHDVVFASRPLTMCTDMISNGYLSTAVVPYGEQWMKMKKIIIKNLLSPLRHKWLQDKRVEEADNLMFYVYNKFKNVNDGGGGLVNVRTAAQHYTGNVIRKMIFNTRYFGKGRKDGGPGLEEVEHIDAIFTLLRYLYAFCVSDYIPCLRGLDLDGHESRVKKAMKIIKKYHDPIIDDRIKQWNDESKMKGEDLLDIMITLKDVNNRLLLTREEIKAQILELMLASVDNPSNSVEWTLAEMINQPELLQRATEELDNVIGKDRLVQESDIPKLSYVKACVKESLRLHPIVPFNLPHVSMNDTTVANYLIPKGSHVYLSRQEIGRNPKFWNEPLKFKPERHLKNDGSEVVLTDPELSFMTFGTGRRGCPGVMLGTTITVILLARLLHGFTWTAPPNVSSVNLAESNGYMLLVDPLVAVAKPRLQVQLYH